MAEEKSTSTTLPVPPAKDSFQSFLLAAAVSGVAVGGTVLGWFRADDREMLKEITALQVMVANLKEVTDRDHQVVNAFVSLTVRVEQSEKLLDKQGQILESLRHSTVPLEQQRLMGTWKKSE